MPVPFQRYPQRFISRGIQISRPADLMDEGKYIILKNVRSYIDGVIKSRPGISAFNSSAIADLNIHSLALLNDPLPGATKAYALLAGAGADLYVDNNAHNALSSVDTGYSGDPLGFVHVRPLRAPSPWTYVGDRSRKRKVNSSGTDYDWGIAPPTQPLTAALSAPIYKTVSDFENTTESAVAWTAGGTAGAITTPDRLTAGTLITYILYDTGSTGWASIVPATFNSDLREGMFFTTGVTTAETSRVEEIFEQLASTEIGSIAYDSGTTGLCTIQPKVPMQGLRRDMLLRIAATENVRVLSITNGPDGIASFRCSTTGTRAANDAIAGLRSFRAYLTNTANTTTTLTTKCFQSTITVGTGYVQHVLARDLTSSNTTTGKPFDDADNMHISLYTSDPTKVTEIRLMIDLIGSSFDQQLLYFVLSQSDLQSLASGTISPVSAIQRAIQRQEIRRQQNIWARQSARSGMEQMPILEDPGFDINPIDDGQILPGASNWTEVIFTLGDLQRIGGDLSRTLKDVAAIRVQVVTTDTITFRCDAWWVGGGNSLDTSETDNSYLWAYRYRSSITGAVSNFSPPMRSGLSPRKQAVVLTPVVSSDAQVDQIEYARFGGSNNDGYHLLGVTPNSGTFTDNYADFYIRDKPVFDLVSNYQPFPTIDAPKSGTCDVRGTEILWKTGDKFNTSWSRKSIIKINGVETFLYTQPTDDTHASIETNLGTLSSVQFYVEGATLLNQNLAAIWGPFSTGGLGEFIFACGDNYQPGTVFWTNPNDPDSTMPENSLDITSGSEVLVNGCIYDGRSIIFSNRRYFLLDPSFGGGTDFVYRDIANSRGLFCRTGLCVGDLIYFVSEDGIYASEGGQPSSLTEDLYQLFPHNGLVGENIYEADTATVLYFAPDFTQPTKLRLEWHAGFLYFSYVDVNSAKRTLILDTRHGAWYQDVYSAPLSPNCYLGVQRLGTHQLLMGASNGKVYQQTGTTDAGAAIASQVRTRSLTLSEDAIQKLFGDLLLDINPNGATVVATVGFNSFATQEPAVNVTGSSRAQTSIDFESGKGKLARDIGVDLTWSGNGPTLYQWQPSLVPKPMLSATLGTDLDDGGYKGPKWLQGVRIRANTFGVAKSIQVRGDNDSLIATLSVNNNGEQVNEYSWTPPIVTHLMRLVPANSTVWDFIDLEWIFNPHPPLATHWVTQPTSHGLKDFHHLRSAWITLESTDSVTFTISIDGVDYSYTIASTGGEIQKVRVPLYPHKGLIYQYSFASAVGCRVFQKDCVVLVGEQSRETPYGVMKPFGDISYTEGARV